MTRSPTIALIAGLCLTLTARADDKTKPSPVAKRILDRAVGKVRANRQEFDKANEKPLSEARQELQDLSTKLIKDGKTDEATAILGQVKTLEADVMRLADAPAPVGGAGRAVPQKPLLERMAGKWRRSNKAEYVQVERDGSVSLFRDAENGVVVTGRLTIMPTEVVEISWKNGFRWPLLMAGEDAVAVLERNGDGNRTDAFVLERVK